MRPHRRAQPLSVLCLLAGTLGCIDAVPPTSPGFPVALDAGTTNDDAGDGTSRAECDGEAIDATGACVDAGQKGDTNQDEQGCEKDWYFDRDDDGYGGELAGRSCTPLTDAIPRSGDCDDDNALVHPNSTERADGVDSNCNGVRDWLVKIYVAVDDAGELCINDETLGDTGSWNDGKYYEKWMSSGAAAIGIYGWDVGYYITAGIAHIEISDGTIWVSDESWMYSPDPNDESSKAGWCTPAFDDSSWQAVQDIGPIGVEPWGSSPSLFPEDSPARWIWDYFPVELNSQYLRTVIVLP